MTRRSFAVFVAASNALAGRAPARVTWRELPSLPQSLGGQFVGVVAGELVVAGGSFFDTPPWAGGKKQFADTVYRLRRGAAAWETAGRLPEPLAAGTAVTTPDGLLCLGGQGAAGHSRRCVRLRLRDGVAVFDELPELPESAAMLAGALSGNTVYVTGGQPTPTATAALATWWALPLDAPEPAWRSLPPAPGPGRIYPVVAAVGEDVYVASGATLTGSLGPPLGRRFLDDVWRFRPGSGWSAVRPLPHAVQAGVGLAWKGELVVFGGNDGSLADREWEVRERHPGFRREVYRFDAAANQWREIGRMPHSLVTTGVVASDDEFVIAGGEDRPAHRSARVFAGRL